MTGVLSVKKKRVIILKITQKSQEAKMSTREEIQKLKREKNAVILAHYYVNDEVQEIADYIGDSFYLSKVATKIDAAQIIFAGVSFMGESAKILNPAKRVFMPDAGADCAMAHMVDMKKITQMREQYEDLAVVCYINSTAEIKTFSDVCVTSANAVKIVKNLPNKNIFFIPDGNLGEYVKEQIPEKNVILNNGYCPIHAAMTTEQVKKAKETYPDAEFLVHPECKKEILAMADYIGSTSGIINYATNSEKTEFIIGTENGVFYELKKKNPGKKFYPLSEKGICQDMKTITLTKILNVLKNEENEVFVSDEVRQKAMRPLERMLALAE